MPAWPPSACFPRTHMRVPTRVKKFVAYVKLLKLSASTNAITDHFKQGKCMLDWNDDEDDSHDDDNMDDDDDNNDRPDSGGGFGNNKPFYPPAPQGGSGPKYNGNGGGGYGGQQPPQGGFFQFQLQQYNNPAGEHESPIAERHIKLTSTDHFKQRSTHGWHSVEKKDNADVVARDAIFKSQVLKEASVCEQSPASSLASSSHRVKAFTTPSPYHLTENGEKAKEDVTNTVTPTSTLEALSDPKKHAQACEDTRLKLRSVEDRGDSAYWLLVVLKLVEAVAIEEQRKSNSHGEVKDQSSDLIFSMSNRGYVHGLQTLTGDAVANIDSIVPNYLALLNSGVRDEALSTYRALWREVFRQYEEHFEKLTGEACSLRRPPRPSLLPPPPLLIGYNTNIGQPFLGVFTGRSGSDQHTSTHLTQSSCLGSDKLDAMAFFASITSRTLTPISLEVFEHSLPAGLITGLGAEAAVLRSELHAQKLRIPIESAPETLLQVPSPPLPLPSASSGTGQILTLKQCWKGITTLLDSQSFLSVKLLGTGGFSTVDEVVHRETSLRISRKTLKNREESALEELKKEVNVLQKLRHPHIIRFLGAYSKGDKMSILLSPVAETTLALWLDNTMSSKQEGLAQTIVKMYGCLASSIRYLHEQRPVVKHMDIKPQNILVMHGNQDFPHVVLSDFGISSFDNTASHEKSKPLTRQYCAPEVSEGISREQAADIWSLGCVYAEMASAAFRDDNPRWLDFRQEFSGREGKYYWQDISSLQEWLSVFLDRASTLAEATVVRTVKSMLSAEPVERPSASLLTMIFTPAPCCLNWPNDKVTYPGPLEELRTVEMLVHDDVVDCRTQLHLHSSADDKEQPDSFSRAKGWLNECFHDHDTCRRQPNEAKSLPARLVDIQPNGIGSTFVRIVDTAELDLKTVSVDYIAVSYVWSENDVTLSTELLQAMQSELPREALPKAMNEAISATDRVGYRYIWVDSLCVLQDSEDDKQRECKAMVSIYRNAALTMVLDQLSDTTDAQPGMSKDSSSSGGANSALRFTSSITSGVGISGRIEHQLTASASLPAIDFLTPGFAWDTRAWALQERLLSRRLLVLGQEQMYWECNALKASETFPRGLPPLLWEKVHTKPSPDVRPIHIKCEHATGSRLGDPDELLRRSVRALGPRLLRNCQWIKKEGDGIGDAMEAAQMELELPVLEVKAHTIDNVKSKIHGDDRQGGDDTATSGHAPISGLTDDFGLPTKVEGHQLLPTTASLLPANREPQDNFFHHNDFTQGGRSAFDCPTSCGVGDALIDNKAHPTIFSGQSDSFGSLGGPSCNDSIAEDVKPNFPYGKNITLDANGAECAHPTPRRAQREPFDWYCCKCDDGPVPNDDVAVQIKQDVDVEESFGSRKDKRDEHNGNVHDGMVMKVDDEDVDVDMDRD